MNYNGDLAVPMLSSRRPGSFGYYYTWSGGAVYLLYVWQRTV